MVIMMVGVIFTELDFYDVSKMNNTLVFNLFEGCIGTPRD